MEKGETGEEEGREGRRGGKKKGEAAREEWEGKEED